MPDRYPIYPANSVHGPSIRIVRGIPVWKRHPLPEPIDWLTPNGRESRRKAA